MFLKRSLRSMHMRLEVVGARKNGRESVSPSRAPVLSCAHYFQAPATQATKRGNGKMKTGNKTEN